MAIAAKLQRQRLIDPGQPDAAGAALDGDMAVYQNRGSMRLERADNVAGAHADIMVAENAIALGSGEAGQDLRTHTSGPP